MVGVSICRQLEPRPSRFDVTVDQFLRGGEFSLLVNKDLWCITCKRDGGRILKKRRHGFSILAISLISFPIISREDVSPDIIVYLTRDLRLILVAYDLLEFEPQILLSISLLSDPQVHEAYLSTTAFTPANSTPISTSPTSANILQTLTHPVSGFTIIAEIMPCFLVAVRVDNVLPDLSNLFTGQSYVDTIKSFTTTNPILTPKNKLVHEEFPSVNAVEDDDSLESLDEAPEEHRLPIKEDYPEIQEMLETCECQSAAIHSTEYSPTSYLKLSNENTVEAGLFVVKKESFSIELDGPDDSLNLFNCKRSKRRNKWRILDFICQYSSSQLRMVVALRKIFQLMSPGYLVPSRLLSFCIDRNLKIRPLDRERHLPWDTNRISLIWNFKQPDTSRTPGDIEHIVGNHPPALQDRLWAFSDQTIQILNNPLDPDSFLQKDEVVIVFNPVLYRMSTHQHDDENDRQKDEDKWDMITSVVCNELVHRKTLVGTTSGRFYRFYPCSMNIKFGQAVVPVTPLTILVQRLSTDHSDDPPPPLLLIFSMIPCNSRMITSNRLLVTGSSATESVTGSLLIRAVSDCRLELTLDEGPYRNGVWVDKMCIDSNVVDELANYVASGSPVSQGMSPMDQPVAEPSRDGSWLLAKSTDRKRDWEVDTSEIVKKTPICLASDRETPRDLVVNERGNACVLLETADSQSKAREIRTHEYLNHVEVATAKDLKITGVSAIWCIEHDDFDALVIVSVESMDRAAIGKTEVFGIRDVDDIWGTQIDDEVGPIDKDNYTLDIAYVDKRLVQITPNEIRYGNGYGLTEVVAFDESAFAVEAHITSSGIAVLFEDNSMKLWALCGGGVITEVPSNDFQDLRFVSLSSVGESVLGLEKMNNCLDLINIRTGRLCHIWAPIATSDTRFPALVDVYGNSMGPSSQSQIVSWFKAVALIEGDHDSYSLAVFLENGTVGVYHGISTRLSLMTMYEKGSSIKDGLRPRVFKRNPGEYLVLPLGCPRRPLIILHDETKLKIFEMRDETDFEFYDDLSSIAPMWSDPQRFYMVTQHGELGLIRITSVFQNKWPCQSTVLLSNCGVVHATKFCVLGHHVSVILQERIVNDDFTLEEKYRSWVRLINTDDGTFEDMTLETEDEIAVTTVLLDYGSFSLVGIGTIVGKGKCPRGRLLLRKLLSSSQGFSKYSTTAGVTVIGKFVHTIQTSNVTTTKNFIYYASGSRLYLQEVSVDVNSNIVVTGGSFYEARSTITDVKCIRNYLLMSTVDCGCEFAAFRVKPIKVQTPFLPITLTRLAASFPGKYKIFNAMVCAPLVKGSHLAFVSGDLFGNLHLSQFKLQQPKPGVVEHRYSVRDRSSVLHLLDGCEFGGGGIIAMAVIENSAYYLTKTGELGILHLMENKYIAERRININGFGVDPDRPPRPLGGVSYLGDDAEPQSIIQNHY